MFGFNFKSNEIKRLNEENKILYQKIVDLDKELNINKENFSKLYFENEKLKKQLSENYMKDCDINDFMKTIQLMAKEKIKNNDDVYLVSYYVDLYKFIEDLKHRVICIDKGEL